MIPAIFVNVLVLGICIYKAVTLHFENVSLRAENEKLKASK